MYAKGTSVPIERSRQEIERLVEKYKATNFLYGHETGFAMVGFKMKDRFVRFRLPLAKASKRTYDYQSRSYVGEDLSEERAAQRNRERWRALVLVLKAKLEAVESGISDFETEFLGNVMVAGGMIVADLLKPELERTYSTGCQLALPPGFGS